MTRARDLGVPFDGVPGRWNAITDVSGVEVGYTTLVTDDGGTRPVAGAVRTGVTAVLPRGKASHDPVFAGWFPLNGNGEMTGTAWVDESGFLEGPIMITNTHSVGVVRDAVVAWQARGDANVQPWSLPVVAETYDGFLNDINGFHVKEAHVWQAIESAGSDPPAEGNVGGGTGMICYGFKGGTGTASRILDGPEGEVSVGVLVQANFGRRDQLLIAGVPVGRAITGHQRFVPAAGTDDDRGSIIVVVATDAPLLPHQLKRIAKRAALGIARTGGMAGNGSGDLCIAFSTANPGAAGPAGGIAQARFLANDHITPLFDATVLATEEAIINALVAAETMTGLEGRTVYALPHDELKEVLAKYGRPAM